MGAENRKVTPSAMSRPTAAIFANGREVAWQGDGFRKAQPILQAVTFNPRRF
jgi:hypothetical protein